jgi:hypothetical protein
MRFSIVALGLLATACSPAETGDNPRDRKGGGGQAAWYVVAQDEGHAAFLAKPGTAPDLVLWCRNDGFMTLRAHVFDAPSANPNLTMTTSGGTLAFTQVRRQGGVRAGDRKLVEGRVALTDPSVAAIVQGAAKVTVTSGSETFAVQDADPNTQLPPFAQACASGPKALPKTK